MCWSLYRGTIRCDCIDRGSTISGRPGLDGLPTPGLARCIVVVDLLGEVVEDSCQVASGGPALREDGGSSDISGVMG